MEAGGRCVTELNLKEMGDGIAAEHSNIQHSTLNIEDDEAEGSGGGGEMEAGGTMRDRTFNIQHSTFN